MNRTAKRAGWAIGLCLGLLIGGVEANAAEIVLVSGAGPMPEMLGALAPMFERASGHKVKLSFKPAPAMQNDVRQGSVDVVVANPEPIDQLAKEGLITTSSRLMLSKVGVAVRAGAPKPTIQTAEQLKAALLAAKSVAYSQGASGQHFVTVIARLGIGDALKPKTVIVTGRPVGAAVASGEAEIGIQQVAELMPVAGIDLIGPLPPEVQTTIVYSAAVPSKAKEAEAAKALVNFLSSEAAVSVIKQKGMQPAG
jgi:molybdate transport system substrate-binding protein